MGGEDMERKLEGRKVENIIEEARSMVEIPG